MRFLAFVFCLFLFSNAFATRTIKFSVPKDQGLQISNPSGITVGYDLECFDTSGASIALINGESLASNATKVYGGAGTFTCAAGATPTNTSTNSIGLVRCAQASTTFANAATRCDAFSSLCTLQQVITAEGEMGTISDIGFWFDINTASWDFSTNFGSTFTNNTAGFQASTNNSFSDSCRDIPDQKSKCAHTNPASALNGTLCCPGTNSGLLCKVTVNTTNGFLASPQFKGGAPF